MTFESFLKTLAADTYPEPPCEIHSKIIREMVPKVVALCPKFTHVLDVGCGQGVAFKEFHKAQCEQVIGMTTNPDDFKRARALTHDINGIDQDAHFSVYGTDMHEAADILFPNHNFDLIWARHVLEHSPAPYYVLHEFKRILKPGGILYVEVPSPETSCLHEFNKQHYSVLGQMAWSQLIDRAGFEILEMESIELMTAAGPDTYFWWIARLRI